jgi:sugar/nucleoside kinase (ribokinase family)
VTHVVVVGDLMVDVVVVPSGPLVRGSDRAASVRTTGGGSGANTACWLASLGVEVRLVAAVGDDALGRGAVEAVTRLGVSFVGSADPDRSTGACVVLVEPDGERTMLPDRGANDALPVAAVEAALASPPRWLHLSGYTLLDEGSRPAGLAALAAARAAEVPTSVDASSAGPLRALGGARFLEWVEGCAVLFANDDELDALGGLAPALDHVEVVVAKHGPDGASWCTTPQSWSAPARSAALVDTIGAGDAFDAGVIDAVLRGLDPAAALEAASLVAARAVATAGARPEA